MAMSGVQFKVMPDGVEVDLEALKVTINSKIEEMDGIPSSVEEQPIAFGLKALIFSFAYPEEKDVDQVNNAVNEVENVSSSEMIDYRRALG
ncbi:elongation factor 1-beta [Candidatus Pacearchaeota archaeon]|nr:elongation factor 1-beta [Candidatus Pacearchaeota archaeon]|tara:strand:- start:8039 stop:8311 length:273 start_codon:yes stop_codon:yes gene_type:complete